MDPFRACRLRVLEQAPSVSASCDLNQDISVTMLIACTRRWTKRTRRIHRQCLAMEPRSLSSLLTSLMIDDHEEAAPLIDEGLAPAAHSRRRWPIWVLAGVAVLGLLGISCTAVIRLRTTSSALKATKGTIPPELNATSGIPNRVPSQLKATFVRRDRCPA